MDKRNYSLKKHNTFGIDAQCRRYVEFNDEDELKFIIHSLSDADKPLMVLGAGSNILFTKDFDGAILHSVIKGINVVCEDTDHVIIRVGSGEKWDDVVALCVRNGWYGAENLSLIPGEVGASAVQNIGAYGAEVKDLIYRVDTVSLSDGKNESFDNIECGYGYRQSRFKTELKGKYVITHVSYKLNKSFKPLLDYGNIREVLNEKGSATLTAQQLRDAVIEIRKRKLPDPDVEGNAGSFFMNPIVNHDKFETLICKYPNIKHYTIDAEHEKIPAGWMIEQCGWKGRALGNAAVHDKQALVLVNRGGATGDDVLRLSNEICKDVKEKFGIEIHPEVNII